MTSLQSTEAERGFTSKLMQNMKQIGIAISMPEIYMVISYFLLSGVLNPDFGDFGYYFMMNVCQISKFQYSLMGVIGQITGILGTMYYEKNLKDIEVRTLIYYSTWVSLVSSLCSYGLAVRWNK